ncbi:MAG: bifunctional phosphopantothenoylcysteine decarboxylase/phosphopantothenate synthase [Planctomycetaceae bacterium]|nr:bifunctional phosphopantothenoylcysteine decarboxylase/phosphopantothenate synthase [Planctomycetaceae bacterium]
MKILVTAGNTQTPLDRVRCITNIFTGQTGTGIAIHAWNRGHDVCLLTSHPELTVTGEPPNHAGTLEVCPFRTFDDLHALLEREVTSGKYDAIIHCAAVSDFQLEGAFSPAAGAGFDDKSGRWIGPPDERHLVDAAAGKIKSRHDELWLRLTPTPKLVDRIRCPWEFRGLLVKFKLEVDVSDSELAEIARTSRKKSDADLIVANTLAGIHDWAMLIDRSGRSTQIPRGELADSLLHEIESLHQNSFV